MKTGLDNTVTALCFVCRYSAATENLLFSYLISSALIATLTALWPTEQVIQTLFVVPYTYLFLITRLDQTSGILSFYQVMGVSNLAQIIAKLLFLQLLTNAQLAFLLLLSTLLPTESALIAPSEASAVALIYILLALTYWRYWLLLTALAVIFVPLSFLLLWSRILPDVLIFNCNCVLLLLILISDSYED